MFTKAERKKTYLKIGLQGPPGSGKTKGALLIAKGFGASKIAVIDTENGSSSLYSKEFDFDSADMNPPFLTDKYMKAIDFAVANNYDFLIIDSITHAWSGPGGLLEQKEVLDSRPNSNHWTNWGPITKKQNEFMAKILHSPIHIICTMRSKVEYAQQEINGKKKVVKLGMAAQQREGVEYEFTTVFDIDQNHNYEAVKDRTELFKDIEKISEKTGKQFKEWLEI